MKRLLSVLALAIPWIAGGNEGNEMKTRANILYLHHSTGNCIWKGGVPEWIAEHNQSTNTAYRITEQAFPKSEPYGWRNYPYDYWNIWVNNAGESPYQDEPTLEMLTREFDTIVFKHCFPVSSIQPDEGPADIASEVKTLGNYKLQYIALKEKMRSFPDTRFLVWTNAALLATNCSEDEAQRSREFVDWVIGEWDEPGDNIFVWDFFSLETDSGRFMNPAYANGAKDPHPNEIFSARVAPFFSRRLVSVLEGTGDRTSLTGE